MLLLAASMTFSQCHLPSNRHEVVALPNAKLDKLPQTKANFEFKGNGKSKSAASLTNVYTETSVSDIPFPAINNDLYRGLRNQLKVLKYHKKAQIRSYGKVDINITKLEQTVQALLDLKGKDQTTLPENLSAFQIEGEDGKGNVFFTGYFTPVLKVSKTQTERFKYPLYAKPNIKGKLPSRAEIDGKGVLKDKGLELAYAENLSDIYFMQVQGSGIVEYPDGNQELFAYAGSNQHSYRSIGKYMIKKGYTTPQKVSLTFIKRYLKNNPEEANEILYSNPSYIFFERTPYQKTPNGAGVVPLTSDYSIAVDTKYIPLGSCLLAAVPIINKKNRVIRHEYRVLIAQDKGGAIKGAGHVDLYCGPGRTGQRKASALHHYGKLWLLLPNENEAAEDTKELAVR